MGPTIRAARARRPMHPPGFVGQVWWQQETAPGSRRGQADRQVRPEEYAEHVGAHPPQCPLSALRPLHPLWIVHAGPLPHMASLKSDVPGRVSCIPRITLRPSCVPTPCQMALIRHQCHWHWGWLQHRELRRRIPGEGQASARSGYRGGGGGLV